MRKLLIFLAAAFSATPAAADWWTKNQCVRALPEPALKSATPGHSFTINAEEGTANETALLGGKAITIIHSGCENLIWDMRVALGGAQEPTLAQAWIAAEALLAAVKPHKDFLYGIDDALAFIDLPKTMLPRFGDFSKIDDLEIGTSLAIELVEPSHTLSVVLTQGPL